MSQDYINQKLEEFRHLIKNNDINSAVKEINELRRSFPNNMAVISHWADLALSLQNNELVISYIKNIEKSSLNTSAKKCVLNLERRAQFQNRNYEKAMQLLIDEITIVSTNEKIDDLLSNESKIIPSNSLEIALEYLEELTANNVPITFQGGTLLGLIRENKIIDGDKDIDLCVDIRYINIVRDYFFKKNYKIFLGNSIYSNFMTFYDLKTNITVDVMGIKFDDNQVTGGYFESDGNKQWSRYLRYPKYHLIKQNIMGREIFMPNDSENILTYEYGDWKISNPNWITFLDAPNLIEQTTLNIYLIYAHYLSALEKHNTVKVDRIKKELNSIDMPSHHRLKF